MTKHLLHSKISGNGEPLVLIHGYLSSSQYFEAIRPQLERSFTVIALDLLGFGSSPKPKVAYTYDDHLAAIHDTLEQLGIKKPFTLLGHSMGALIALRYACIFADDVSRLIMFNPPLFTDTSQMIQTHRASGRRYRIMLYSRGRHVFWLSLRFVPRNFIPKRRPLNFTDIVRMSPHAREGSYKHILGGSRVFQDLRIAKQPILLVNGRYDRAVYLENLRGRNLPANVHVETVESGHHTLVKNVDVAERLIRSHLLQ